MERRLAKDPRNLEFFSSFCLDANAMDNQGEHISLYMLMADSNSFCFASWFSDIVLSGYYTHVFNHSNRFRNVEAFV